MGVGSSSPFDVGPEITTHSLKSRWHWAVHSGKRRGDTSPKADVTIFRANVQSLGEKAKMAKHAFNKTKTLRHPHILEYIDGSDTETEITLVSLHSSSLSFDKLKSFR